MGYYRLPNYVGETLSREQEPPRHVPMFSIVLAVLAGADCAIYAASGLLFITVGVIAILADPGTSSPGARPTAIGAVFISIGLVCVGLAAFRVWRVQSALRKGEAHLAEITDAEVGRARLYGTPWGEPLFAAGVPIAARGAYQLIDTGETGKYYMQQSWALRLRRGDRIWVLRRGRDVLYAPSTVSTVSMRAAT
jgi:hypothetical protein